MVAILEPLVKNEVVVQFTTLKYLLYQNVLLFVGKRMTIVHTSTDRFSTL